MHNGLTAPGHGPGTCRHERQGTYCPGPRPWGMPDVRSEGLTAPGHGPGACRKPAPARHHHGFTGGTHAHAESVWGRDRGSGDRRVVDRWIGGSRVGGSEDRWSGAEGGGRGARVHAGRGQPRPLRLAATAMPVPGVRKGDRGMGGAAPRQANRTPESRVPTRTPSPQSAADASVALSDLKEAAELGSAPSRPVPTMGRTRAPGHPGISGPGVPCHTCRRCWACAGVRGRSWACARLRARCRRQPSVLHSFPGRTAGRCRLATHRARRSSGCPPPRPRAAHRISRP